MKKPRNVDFSNQFNKQLKKAPTEIKKALRKRYALFLENPSHPQLHNHQLTGKFRNSSSINVTGDWRVIYSSREKGDVVIFELLGTHSQLYK